MKKKPQVLAFLFWGIQSLIFGQPSNRVWLDWEHKPDGLAVKGLFINNENQNLPLTYSLDVAFTDSTGLKKRQKAGAANSSLGIPLILSQARLKNLRPSDSVSVAFSVFSKEHLLGKETYRGTSDDILKKIKEQPSPDELEIEGIILDETRTKPGHDFYEIFNLNWTPPPGRSNYFITLRELPARASRQNQIVLLLNDLTVAQYWLDTNLEFLEEDVLNAIQLLTSTLDDLDNLEKQIENEDQVGDGVF